MDSQRAPGPTGRSIQLGISGEQARIIPDEHDDGWVLEIGGAVQSHVDLADPTRIRYEYLRRMANVLDASWPAAAPIRILHLGAGALTLPRYVQATRPGSVQTVVDLDRELPSFVTAELPLPEGTDLTVVTGDARDALGQVPAGPVDAVVLDIATAAPGAEHLTGARYYAELLERLTADGVLLVNIGDDSGLRFLGRQARALEEAAAEARLAGAWALADAALLERLGTGNVVLAAGGAFSAQDPEGLRARLLAAGPHPAAVLDPTQLAGLVDRTGHSS